MGCGESSQAYETTYTPIKTADRFDKLLGLQLLTKSDALTEPRTAEERIRRKGRLTQQQISTAYEKASGNLQKFFDELSERISEYYMQLSAEGIESMTQHKLTQVQTKVYLSEQFLLQTFDILQFIGTKVNFDYDLGMFKTFNKSQTVLINYIKQKYPRAGNIFVPGDLTQVFREFNMLENSENDILRNAGICFMDSSDEAIIKKLKHFFNILIDELDNKFPVFQNLLQQRVFTRIIDGKKISFNYKIGRKIPQNTAKFQADEGDELTITSPELFRMIIKWVGQLEQFLNFPDDKVDQKQTFKVYSVDKDETYFDDITPDQSSSLTQTLKSKLKQISSKYSESIHSLLKEMDMFNINLLKILFTTDRKQKYVPRHEAQVIKFAMYNTKLVSWLLAEKLITVLKNLINVGVSFEDQEIAKRMDLVKFNVSDLLRAMVIGNRKEILIVYENLKKLEQQGTIKITKIKNRLGTPLNDVMVLFTFKESFILCQLQLILSDNQGVSEKVKNIEVLNHFLYELVRSPNGVLSEVAVLLGYKDNKINYEDKIRFENKSFRDFKSCQQEHPEAVQCYKVQKKPFICSNCTEFYHPFENIFGLKRCQKCFMFQCCRCMFKHNKELQENQIHLRFVDQLTCLINDDRTRKGNFSCLSKDVTIEDILKCFWKKKLYFKNIFKKNFQKLKPKDIQDYIKKGQFQLEGYYESSTSFILVQFKGQNTFIKCFYWNSIREEIQNLLGSSENFYDIEKVGLSNYDFIMLFDTRNIAQNKPQLLQKTTKLCIKPEFQYQNVKKFYTVKIFTKNKSFDGVLIVRVELNQTQKIEGAQQQLEEMSQKKQFLFSSIAQARKSFPKVGLVLQNFIMKNCGVTAPLINEYFGKFPDKAKIKTINLSNNKITDAQIILNQCLNLQTLLLSKNFIKNLIFVKPLKNLTKLIVFENKIVQISGLVNTPALKKLNVQSNKLKTIQVLDLKNLIEIVISHNQIQQFDWLEKSKLPNLETLLAIECGSAQEHEKKSYKFTFLKLKKIVFERSVIKQLILQCPELKFIECSNCQMMKLAYSSNFVQFLNINYNSIENLQHLLTENNQNIKKFYADSSGKLPILPKLAFENLQILSLYGCDIDDVSNLEVSNIPKLTQITLSSNNFVRIPVLNFPNLKIIGLDNIYLKEVQNFSQSDLPMLEQLNLFSEETHQIPECPSFKFPQLKTLRFSQFNFLKMDLFSQSQLPKLENLTLAGNKVKQFPKITFKELKMLNLNGSSIQSLSNFNVSVFPKLQVIDISQLNSYDSSQQNSEEPVDLSKCITKVIDFPSLKSIQVYYYNSSKINLQNLLKCNMPNLNQIYFNYSFCNSLPVMNTPQLTTLTLITCKLTDISNLASSNLSKLTQLSIEGNNIKQLPKMNMPSLKTLNLSGNLLVDVSNLNKSHLPCLENLNIDRNKLTEFPLLKLPSLKQFSIVDNEDLKNFKKLDHCQMGNLEYLSISNCMALVDTQFPILDLPKVTTVSLMNCKITSITNLQKSKLPKLESLDVLGLQITSLPILKLPKLVDFNCTGTTSYDPNQSKLTDISNLSLWECPQLQHLTIKYTAATVLPQLSFPMLEKIQMGNNKLTNISSLKTSFLPELCQVDFNNNAGLAQIPTFPSGCVIDSIDCSYCNLQSLPDMPELKVKTLNIRQSKVKTIGKISLKQTQNLSIDLNEIEDISLFIRQANKLQYLYINDNQIKVFPDIDFPCLTDLMAYNNLLTAFSLRQKNFPSLSNVNLENNQIQALQEVTAPALIGLNLSRNKLSVINFFKKQIKYQFSDLRFDQNNISSVQYLPSATYLYFSNNKIKNINFMVNFTQKCTNAYLSNNQIEDVSGLFSNKNLTFKQLYSIYLMSNKIKNITFNSIFPNLCELYLTTNFIQAIDNISIQTFPSLITLNVGENNLKKFGPNVSFKQLSTLSFQKNVELQQLKGMNCPLLYTLTITQCGIKNIKWLQSIKLPELNSLTLETNSLTKLPKIDNMPKLKSLYISQNPIQNVDDFLKCQNVKNLQYLGYNLKQSLPMDAKRKIVERMVQANPKTECYNNEIKDESELQQMGKGLQYKLPPEPLQLDVDGNVLIEKVQETKTSKKG